MKINIKRTFRLLLAGLILSVVFIGCTTQNRFGSAYNNYKNLLKADGEEFVHKVRWKGETLSIIAEWYTGDSNNWKALANLDSKLNPTLLIAGNKILIPHHLLKTRKPMPDKFVANFRTNGRISSRQQVENDNDEFFGPKE
jgi:hypothetical protein